MEYMVPTYEPGMTRTGQRLLAAYRVPMHWIFIAVLVSSCVLIIGVVGHLALNWANRKGWVYYRNNDRPPPHSLGLVEEIYQPSIEHVIEQEVSDQTTRDQAESGDPDAPGSIG